MFITYYQAVVLENSVIWTVRVEYIDPYYSEDRRLHLILNNSLKSPVNTSESNKLL